MSSPGFDKNSGPVTRAALSNSQTSFGQPPPSQSLSPSPPWSIGPSSTFADHRYPEISPFNVSHKPGTGFIGNQAHDLRRPRSPPFLSINGEQLQNSGTVMRSHSVLQRSRSPPLIYQKNHLAQGFEPSRETQRHPLPSTPWGNQPNISNNVSYVPAQQDMPVISAYSGDDFGRDLTSKHADIQVHKRTRSPPTPFASQLSIDNMQVANGSKRPSVSPPRSNPRMNPHVDPRSHTWSPPPANVNNTGATGTRSSDVPVPKRSRFPSPPSTNPVFQGNNSSGHDDTEQELQAKAKRLARFKEELSQPEPSNPGNKKQKNQSVVDKRKFIGEASEMAGVLRNNNLSSDYEDQDSSTVIIGDCPDMCPEQERAERERKGDLDQYERFEGDRNQTSESLAVKKYTRTAEREAVLIRPMPILRKTMDYLLNLLDQPYDDRFLGLYNFLWDRMRAIRMDLRMQHIFNLGAITMLEQMIRLHIIAMHELCQYTKGEGFSEGFDAHLNIEQMNKTSVELFQLYDDHRKKGIDVPTEKEFRGYYALLKLDKHPGYKVEPAELSLDLAKMTPEIRQAAEVLFARDVARACRTGNFIAFFRLARKASYLQACLMHAHFGKLRTQALASLHSGLQNNQGIPIIQLAKWLGMEEENIEELLEYHGFIIKEFEEPYMVKEGPFLNGDSEYPLKRSRLVHLKKSQAVVEDVLSSYLLEPSPPKDLKGLKVDKASVQEVSPVISKKIQSQRLSKPTDYDMDDYKDVSLPMSNKLASDRWSEEQRHLEVVRPSPGNIFKANSSVGSPKFMTTNVGKQTYDTRIRNSSEKHDQSNIYGVPVSPRKSLIEPLPDLPIDSIIEDSMVQPVFVENSEPEKPTSMFQEVGRNEVDTTYIDEEVAKAKLKLILRLWRRRTLIKKDLREQKQLAASSALSSLSLGPPIWHYKKQLRPPGDFNIDKAMRKRYEKQEQSWSMLNVSDVVAPKLCERNQYPKCICWKLLFCSSDNLDGDNNISRWLRSKLMPANIDNNNDLAVSSQGLLIWKKWHYDKSTSDKICCLSVVKEIHSNNLVEETIAGAGAIVFLVSETLSLEAQKIRLHNLLSSIPSGSCLPLLLLTGSYGNQSDFSTIVTNLGLYKVEKSKICSFSVVSLVKNNVFFSDEDLRKGLEWLASESPLQPVVQAVKTRELVQSHLNFDFLEANPEHCISAITEALDESIKKIRNAANSNSISWPCPEISLLSEFSNERTIIESYLPKTGWSSGTRIEPLIRTLNNCKLPNVPKDLSLGIDIENQRLRFEDFLVNYLTPLMGSHLAQKESSIMLQNCVGLELHGSSYCIVPKWLLIFRRLFNWQLTSLSNGPFATAYILEQQLQQSKNFLHESYNLISPSLDEMIEVCCRSNLNQRDFQPLKDQMVINGDNSMQEERSFLQSDEGPEEDDDDGVMNELLVESKSAMETDRLSKLLEHCNIVQNMIDKKLSIYF